VFFLGVPFQKRQGMKMKIWIELEMKFLIGFNRKMVNSEGKTCMAAGFRVFIK
jgi:hypothetical protein